MKSEADIDIVKILKNENFQPLTEKMIEENLKASFVVVSDEAGVHFLKKDSFEALKRSCLCLAMPSGVFGVAIQQFLTVRSFWGLGSIFYLGSPIVVFLAQGCLLMHLWKEQEDLLDTTFCEVDSTFQLAVLGTFFVYMTPAVTDLFVEFMVLFFSPGCVTSYTDGYQFSSRTPIHGEEPRWVLSF